MWNKFYQALYLGSSDPLLKRKGVLNNTNKEEDLSQLNQYFRGINIVDLYNTTPGDLTILKTQVQEKPLIKTLFQGSAYIDGPRTNTRFFLSNP